MRRTKHELSLMENDVTYYLLQTNNNPHQAHELMIKEYLESNQSIPYYIQGVKDFIKVSQDLAIQLNRIEQMNRRQQAEAQNKQQIIKWITSLSLSKLKEMYINNKNNLSETDKLNMADVINMAMYNDLKESNINQSIINTFKQFYKGVYLT